MKRERERPRALDLFCGQGGASMGYHMAGFQVVGVDIEEQPNYPFEFIQADALTFPLDGFAFISASPPCQGYGRLRHRSTKEYPRLIEPIRERLRAVRIPYVIENVADARPYMINPVQVCGSAVRLRVQRHRLFESNLPIYGTDCDHSWQDDHKPYKIYVGKSRLNGVGFRTSGVQPVYGGNHNVGGRSHFMKSVAMGIDWMDEFGLNESIPPAYTDFIGRQVIKFI